MSDLVFGLLAWIIIPGIMLGVFLLSASIARYGANNEHQVSAWFGFGAGLLIFVVYVIARLPEIKTASLNFDHAFDITFSSWLSLAIGGIIGFALLSAILILRPSSLIGIVTLILSAASSCALFSYFFITTIRNTFMFFTIGLLFGVFIFGMLFPNRLRDLVNYRLLTTRRRF